MVKQHTNKSIHRNPKLILFGYVQQGHNIFNMCKSKVKIGGHNTILKFPNDW